MIKYIELVNSLTLPGQGGSNKWTAVGDKNIAGYKGQCERIEETNKGFAIYIPQGRFAGIYEMMPSQIRYVFRDLPVAATDVTPKAPKAPDTSVT